MRELNVNEMTAVSGGQGVPYEILGQNGEVISTGRTPCIVNDTSAIDNFLNQIGIVPAGTSGVGFTLEVGTTGDGNIDIGRFSVDTDGDGDFEFQATFEDSNDFTFSFEVGDGVTAFFNRDTMEFLGTTSTSNMLGLTLNF